MWRSTPPEFSRFSFQIMEQLSFEEGLVIARHVENVPKANDRCFRLPTSVLNSAK
jgi:hypothetical protein